MTRKRIVGGAIVLAFAGWAGRAAAASWEVQVSAAGTKADAVAPFSITSPMPVSAGQVLTVTCDAASDCTKVTAVEIAGGKAHALATAKADKGTVSFAMQSELAPADLEVLYAKKKLLTASLTQAKTVETKDPEPAASSSSDAATSTAPLTELLATACPRRTFTVDPYNRAGNVAEVVITPRGSLLTPLPESFDEDDMLRVTVYADARLMPLLKVARKSGFRAVGGINILGMDVAVPPSLKLQGAGLKSQAQCTTATFVLRDFASGKGEVELTIVSGNDPVVIGGFEFAVHPLYTGMFSLGGLWTNLLAPGFDVATQGGQSVVVQNEQGKRRFAYAFLYTPFVWASRDIVKGAPWYEHVNPSIGFVLDHPLDNAFLGATVDFNASVLVTGGVIFSHVQKLQGVNVGDAFSGTADQLPITHSWEHDWFVAVSVDLRAAVALVRAVVTSPATP
jgi:hypothetical protein